MQSEELRRWIKGFFITCIVFAAFSIYLYLRRGYYNAYIINKVFGSTAAVVAGLTLFIGPLAHRFRSFSLLMPIRRQLGLLALAFGLSHTLFSVCFLPEKFPLSWYGKEITPILFGALAILLWIYVASVSSNASIKQLGVDRWRWIQKICGHTAFIAIYLHLVIMKYQGWINWWQGKVKVTPELANPSYPPASTFVLLIMSAILIYRGLLAFRKHS